MSITVMDRVAMWISIETKKRQALSGLLNSLISRREKVSTDADTAELGALQTTLRLEPRVRRFVDLQADNLGISVQGFIVLALKSIMAATGTPIRNEMELILARFHELFQSHRIATVDIPRIFDTGRFRLSDFLSLSTLIDRIDSTVLERLAELFHVDPEWINGRSDEPYPPRKSWHDLDDISLRIDELRRQGNGVKVILLVSDKAHSLRPTATVHHLDNGDEPEDGCVVLELQKHVNGIDFSTFEVWSAKPWDSSICQLDLKSLTVLCEKVRVVFEMRRLSAKDFVLLSRGQCLAATVMQQSWSVMGK